MSKPKTTREDFEARITQVSTIDWARLAAFIDGEGSILISRSKRKGYTNLQYNLEVVVSGTDPRLHEWLQNTFSGQVYIIQPSKKSFKRTKICQSWRVFGERAAMLLDGCLLFFIIKREQAEVALSFMRLKSQGAHGRKVSDATLQMREEFRNKLCALNGSWFLRKGSNVVDSANTRKVV